MKHSAYRDVIAVLDTVLLHGKYPAEYTLPNEGAAINWRQRANKLRVEMRKYDLKLNPHKVIGESPYDSLTFILRGKSVLIKLLEPIGVLTLDDEETPIDWKDETDDEDSFSIEGDI